MGIRIDGASDLINATDGSLTIEGQSINSTGIGTFSGGVKVGSAATIHSTGQFNIGVAATIFASGNATFAGITTTAGSVVHGRLLVGTDTEGNANADDLTVATTGETGITIRSGSSSPGNIFFSDATSGAGEYAGEISYKHNTNDLIIGVNGAERLRIRGDGRVAIASSLAVTGICTVNQIQVAGDIAHTGDGDTKIAFTDNQIDLQTGGSSRVYANNYAIYVRSGFPLAFLASSGDSPNMKSGGTNAQDLLFTTGSSNPTRLQITSGGKILGGNHINDRGAVLQIESSDHSQIGIHRNTADHGAPAITLSASRGTSAGSATVVQDDDYLGMLVFKGADGSDLASGAYITGIVDGTPGAGDMPTRLGFWTAADGTESPTERVRIDKNGQLVLSNGSMSTAYGNSICGGTNLELDTTGVIKFRTDTNQRASITDNGLCFGSDSAAANALDDYEEGSCTLVLSDTSGNNATSGGTMNYTKIGRWVNVWGQCTFGDAGSAIGGSHCAIKGWPFAVGSYNSNDIPVWVWNNGTDIYEDGYASVSTDSGGTVWGLYIHVYNGAPSITGSNMGNNARLSCAFSYEAT